LDLSRINLVLGLLSEEPRVLLRNITRLVEALLSMIGLLSKEI